ncbi:MAG: preprotein translocase subunit SecE [Bacteroidetes bacterium]|nr:preprotein translocase subunit SecE [Bacteroidota bacterium]
MLAKIKIYFKEAYGELVNNVTWPTWLELQNNTILVVTTAVLLSVIIFIIDFTIGNNVSEDAFWDGLLGWIYHV